MAGESPQGFCVVDIFESEEAVERFNQAMGTIPRDVGITEAASSSQLTLS